VSGHQNNATCTADGAECVTCERKQTALGCSFTTYVSDNNATCNTDGTETAPCVRACGETDTRADLGSALTHTWVTNADGTHNCMTVGGCNMTNETCSPNDISDTCDKCGFVTPDPTCLHPNTTISYNPAPTCTSGGTRVTTCDDCKGTVSSVEVSVLDHDLPSAWTVRIPATATTVGERFRACLHDGCDYEITEVIPATGGGGTWTPPGTGTTTPPTSTTTPPNSNTTIPPNDDTTPDTSLDTTPTESELSASNEIVSSENPPIIIEYGDGTVTLFIDTCDDILEVILNTSPEIIFNIVFTPEELERIENGENAKVFIVINNINETITAEKKLLISEKMDNSGIDSFIIGMYFDITKFKQIGNDDPTQLFLMGQYINISIEVPDDLRSDGRTFKVIRIHEGEAEIINGYYDHVTGLFMFETDRFSTYALIYSDGEADIINVPETSASDTNNDRNPITGVTLGFTAMLITGSTVLITRKRRK